MGGDISGLVPEILVERISARLRDPLECLSSRLGIG
jgi:hypothetical protein